MASQMTVLDFEDSLRR